MTRYWPLLSLMLLSGCAFSGLDGSSSFTCKAPDGVSCTSVSGVYANKPAPANDANAAAGDAGTGKPRLPSLQPYHTSTETLHAMPVSGAPLLSPPRVLRIWMAPWRDQDGDLRDQAYLYVMWDRGEWNIQHSRNQILDQYAPVTLRNAPVAEAPVIAPEQEAQSMVDKAGEKALPPEVPNAQ